MIDLRDAELYASLQQAAHGRILGQASLRSRNEHADTLYIDHNTTLVLFRHEALDRDPVFAGFFNAVPILYRIQTLLGELNGAFHIVYAHDKGFDLLADLCNILGLQVRIVSQFRNGNVSGMLRTQVHGYFVGTDRSNDTDYFISCI